MDKTYEKFLRSGMDLAAVGIECCRRIHSTSVRQKARLFLAGQERTAFIFASFAVLAEWFFLLIQ